MLRSVYITALAFMLAETANGAVIVNLSGTPGSNVIDISLSGDLTVNSGFPFAFGNAFQMSFQDWTSFGFFPAEAIAGTTQINNTTPPTNPATMLPAISPVSLSGVFFGNNPPGAFESLTLVSSPSLGTIAGNVLEFSGSGSFVLPTGGTFDNLTPGTYNGRFTLNRFEGNDVTLNITSAAIPEPTSLALLGMTAAGFCGVRLRRRRNDNTADNTQAA